LISTVPGTSVLTMSDAVCGTEMLGERESPGL